MNDAVAILDAPPASRTRWQAARELVVVSLAVTACAALLAIPVAAALTTRWSLAFVYLRWFAICVLLAAPLVQQVVSRQGSQRQLPWAMRTPATALLLMTESILFDIASARLGE